MVTIVLLAILRQRSSEQPVIIGDARGASVLLITLDTLRPDRLGCYGCPERTSPHIDRMAREGLLFTHAFAQAPLTAPSHASILTGAYPAAHGVRGNGTYRLNPEATTLAELLGAAGYETAAFVSAMPLLARFGFDQGFETFDEDFSGSRRSSAFREFYGLGTLAFEQTASEVTDKALGWLAHRGREPFFLWVHYFDPHGPYEPPEEFLRGRYAADPRKVHNGSMDGLSVNPSVRLEGIDDLAYYRAAYDGEVAFTDREIGRLLDALRADPRSRPPLIIITADHGEAFGEHGIVGHGTQVFDEEIAIPLIVHHPAALRAGARSDLLVETVDLMPTVLDLVGLPIPEAVQGQSLVRVLQGETGPKDAIYAESLKNEQFGLGDGIHALRTREWKLVESGAGGAIALYDLQGDVAETQNRSRTETGRVGRLAERLLAHPGTAPGGLSATSRVEMDPETEAGLRALGYLGGGGEETGDRWSTVRRAFRAMHAGSPDSAARLLRQAVEQDPGDRFLGSLLAKALIMGSDWDGAAAALERLLADDPDDAAAMLSLAQVRIEQGDPAAAARLLSQAIARAPGIIDARVVLARLQADAGDWEAARRTLVDALRLAPDSAPLRSLLHHVEERRGD